MKNNDTRASSALADTLCPARHLMQAGIPEAPESPEARSGRRIHDRLAAKYDGRTLDVLPGLTLAEEDTYAACLNLLMAALVDVFDDVPAPETVGRYFPECGMSLTIGQFVHTGHADLVVVTPNRVLVVDYKTGRIPVQVAECNEQLRDYAVLASRAWPHRLISVALIQPWAMGKDRLTVCTYGPDEIDRARIDMARRVERSQTPGNAPVPGPVQCKYCRAVCKCPAILGVIPKEEVKLEPSIVSLTDEQLAAFAPLAAQASDIARDEIRRRIEAGGTVPGWQLREGNTIRSVNNLQLLYERMRAAGVTHDAFTAALKLPIDAVETMLSGVTRAKGKSLRAKVDDVLEGIIDEKKTAKILKQV